MKKFFLSLAFAFFGSGILFAQVSGINNYVSRSWTQVDGLPGNTVCDVIQSKDGFLYFGSYECLVKFDGYEFETLNKYTDDNLSFISARSIFEDADGQLWIGSNDEGLEIISKKNTARHLTVEDGLPNNSIRALAQDKKGNVWVGTAGGLVYVTKDFSIKKTVSISNVDLSHVIVSQLYNDSSDRLWLITTEENGLYVFENNIFKKSTLLDSYGNFSPSAITQDKEGNYWIALGQDGIVKVSNGQVEKIKTNTILDTETTNCIYTDCDGSLWFGNQKGLVVYNRGRFSIYQDNSSPVLNDSINKILEDREGNVWIATDNSGIKKISLGKFHINNLSSPVNAICQDNDDNVWVGYDEGLLCYHNDFPVENEVTKICKGIRVRHVALAKNGDLLINCYSSPAQLRVSKSGNRYKIKSWTSEKGLAGNKTRVSLEITNGDLYCGTTTGLSIISPDGSIKNLNTTNGLDNEYIMCLYEDKDGLVWAGTDGGGIYLLKNGNIVKKITGEDGLAGNVIFKITQDAEERYWICTGSGISACKSVLKDLRNNVYDFAFSNLNSSNGLGSDCIFQLLVDKNNLAWMISNRGISSVDFSSMLSAVKGQINNIDCKFYNQNDGLKSTGANSTALSMQDTSGRIWFTMADGFAIYNPLTAEKAAVSPLAQILEVKVDDTVYTDFSQAIQIPPSAKHLDIKYTGLSYTSTERNRFSYMLSGFDKDYSAWTANRTVSYTNLKPGAYTFKLKISNAEGLVSQNDASILFFQNAYIYQKVEFWIALAIFSILLFLLILYLVQRNAKKQQLILQTKIQMATVDFAIAKDESDMLLRNILPESIAERLKGAGGEKTIADSFDDVTVLFSDIVGFTRETTNSTAEDIVTSLNDLFSLFDMRASDMGIEKIKTIGDAYMAACGVPEKNPDNAHLMFEFAKGMYEDLAEYNKTAAIKFKIRIGINSGKVIAGVIGQNKFIYDVWGDTVNVASRMESICTPGHIRFTQAVKEKLEACGQMPPVRSEECNVKGKGLMLTFETL